MSWFFCQSRCIHSESINARIGEYLTSKTSEVAVYGADELGVSREEGEVPGEEGFIYKGELAEHGGALLGTVFDNLNFLGVRERKLAGGELWGVRVWW